MLEPLDGVAAADARLGRPMPLPAAALPLARWVEVRAIGKQGVEVEWNLDDSRPRTPGRLALYAGPEPPARDWPQATRPLDGFAYRSAELPGAEPSLTPVHELSWRRAGLHLRLTGQGAWALVDLVAIASSVVL